MAAAAALVLLALTFDLIAPLLLMRLIDDTLMARDLSQLNILIAVFAVIYAVKFVADLFGNGLKNRFNENILRDVRAQAYDHIQTLSMAFFHQHRTGYLTTRMFADANLMGGLLGGTLIGALANLMLFSGALVVTFYLNWRLTVILLLVVPLLAVAANWFNRQIQGATSTLQEQISLLCAGIQENLSGISLIQSFTLEKFASKRVGKELGKLRRVSVRRADLTLLHQTGIVLMTSMAGLSILWFGSRELVNGTLTMGELMAFLAYAVNVYRPVQGLLNLNLTVQQSVVAASRIHELLDTPRGIADAPDAVELTQPFQGSVRFGGVSFAYGSDDVLSDVAFEVEAGTKVAIVGRSGAGKTTLLNHLPRFYDPHSGHIEIDGTDIRRFTLSSLRKAIGIVSQDTFLFAGTIRDNLTCVRPEATEEELHQVLEAAELTEFIQQQPKGLDTDLGESGVRLSGGEKQRLSIARALLKNPPLLILDEATSSVDSISENQIRRAINGLMTGRRTCFIIAHRFTTILDADRIIVLNRGKVEGQGTHEELYQQSEFYARLYDEQFSATGAAEGTLVHSEPGKSVHEYLVTTDAGPSKLTVETLKGGRKHIEVTQF
ncbi:MAG: ABC transporter ATP-binding protein [bacterium]|nr:ABC transporter ATP-binding protein [bacterium]